MDKIKMTWPHAVPVQYFSTDVASSNLLGKFILEQKDVKDDDLLKIYDAKL